jgi:hypothetical protein
LSAKILAKIQYKKIASNTNNPKPKQNFVKNFVKPCATKKIVTPKTQRKAQSHTMTIHKK